MTILRDWSHALDFVKAFQLMLDAPRPKDYVVARGEPTRLLDYIQLTCKLVGLDFNQVVEIDHSLDQESYDRVADSSLIQKELGWKPKISVEKLCRQMIAWETRRQRESS